VAPDEDVRLQQDEEIRRRRLLARPVLLAGVLYFVGAVILIATSSSSPVVGLLQGIAPALRGEANPTVSPRAAEIKYTSHHAFALISGSVSTGLALAGLTALLLLLYDAARFRRPQTWGPARTLALIGGSLLAILTVAREIVLAVKSHQFAVGADHSDRAVEHLITKSSLILTVGTLGPVTWLVLLAGMIPTLLNAMRVGLLPRWLAYLGMFSAILIVLGGATLEIVPALWLIACGALLAGRWPGGEPPAWAAGEARPWPSAAEQRAARQRGGAGAKPAAAAAGANGGSATSPEPVRPARSAGASRKRRRKGR
jgi:hypothetical protein